MLWIRIKKSPGGKEHFITKIERNFESGTSMGHCQLVNNIVYYDVSALALRLFTYKASIGALALRLFTHKASIGKLA